jgi:hypothetical protein
MEVDEMILVLRAKKDAMEIIKRRKLFMLEQANKKRRSK